MKQSYFVIIWLVGIFFLGCRSEDDDLPLIEDSVEGTWELREVTLQGSGSANVALSPFPVPVTFTGNGAD